MEGNLMEEKLIQKEIFVLKCTSSKDLKKQISGIQNQRSQGSKYVNLVLPDADISVPPFHVEESNLKDLQVHLSNSAVEVLGVPLEDVEMDYQVLNTLSNSLTGIFACISKAKLMEYINVLDESKLICLKVTASILDYLEKLYSKYKLEDQHFCFMNFSNNREASMAVVNAKSFELVRRFPFENASQLKLEVIRSLRSACAKSRRKTFDKIYCFGYLEEKEQLDQLFKKSFEISAEWVSIDDDSSYPLAGSSAFSINLAKKYSFSSSILKKVHRTAQVVLLLCLFLVGSLGYKIIRKQNIISNLKASYKEADYNYALSLKRQWEETNERQ